MLQIASNICTHFQLATTNSSHAPYHVQNKYSTAHKTPILISTVATYLPGVQLVSPGHS